MKILIAITSYGRGNDNHLNSLLQELRKIPLKKDIIINSNIDKDLGNDVKCLVGRPYSDPSSLVFAHRKLFIDNLDNYDLFLYTEDDIIISQQNVEAFLDATRILSEHQVPGFIRYEVNYKNEPVLTDIHSCYQWISKSVRYINSKLFAELNNKHSACYLLTKSQLAIAIQSGNYSSRPRISAGDVLEAGSADPFVECGLEKIINISEIDRFLVPHLSNKYANKWGLSLNKLREQIKVMHEIASGRLTNTTLFENQTKLLFRGFDKKYYNERDDFILQKIGSKKQNILSVGCGEGETEAALKSHGHEVIAIPLDHIIAALTKMHNIEVIEPDLKLSLSILSTKKFDCIMFIESLHYVPEPETYLEDFKKLLGDRGRIIATFMKISSPEYIEIINFMVRNFSIKYDDIYSNNKYELSGFNFINDINVTRDWFIKAGLAIDKIYHYPISSKRRLLSAFLPRLISTKSEKLMIIAHNKK